MDKDVVLMLNEARDEGSNAQALLRCARAQLQVDQGDHDPGEFVDLDRILVICGERISSMMETLAVVATTVGPRGELDERR